MNKLEQEKFQELKEITNIISFKVAVPLYLLFWFLDLIYVPQYKWEFLAIRLTIIPAALLTYVWLRKATTYHSAETAALFLVFICASILNVMIYVIGKGALYSFNLQLVAIGSLSFIPWTSRYFGMAILGIYGPYLAIEATYLNDPTYHAQFAVMFFFIIGVITITWILGSFRKNMHEREIMMRQDLTQEIDRRKHTENELIIARDQALDATRAKEIFLANMSHEMRTPLTAIIGFADSSLDEDQSQDQQISALKTIHQSGNHLLHIINDILDFSKIEAGALQIESLPVKPVQLLAEVEYMMKDQALNKGLEFSINYTFPIPETIHSDPVRIKQVLLNLSSNAIKFTDHGSITIDTRFDETSKKLIFSVKDTGIGMTSEQLTNLFKPFSQADSSIARRFGGTGLGLSLSRQLATLLGGELNVRSKANKGSVFEFQIKTTETIEKYITSINDNQATNDSSNHKTPVHKLTGEILLVEDNELNQLLISNYLTKMGAHVSCADNGAKAIDMVQYHHYDLIYMDMQMPVMSGIEAVQHLRKNGNKTPIVMLTANATTKDKKQCLDAGADGYMTKPIVRETLYETSAQYLVTEIAEQVDDRSIYSTHLLGKQDKTINPYEHFDVLIDCHQKLVKFNLTQNQSEFDLTVHKLNKFATQNGYPQLAQLADRIEAFSHSQDRLSISPLLVELSDLFDRIYLGLSKEMVKLTTATGTH